MVVLVSGIRFSFSLGRKCNSFLYIFRFVSYGNSYGFNIIHSCFPLCFFCQIYSFRGIFNYVSYFCIKIVVCFVLRIRQSISV